MEASPQEMQYLALVAKILELGKQRDDRTGTGTRSIFAPPQMRFDLSNSFPLLTTKPVPGRLVFEELMWFLRGQTDAMILFDKNIHIWDGNNSREYLDSRGLHNNRIGDLGPIYGFQWRHFGAVYQGVEGDLIEGQPISYENQGIDQLHRVIKQICDNPTDRRIILSAWNPADLDNMALPPCHLLAQFYVDVTPDEQPKLSCQLYQRSADVGLGVPFNIASYALLTCMIAHVTGCIAHEFIHVMGDAHIYNNHIEVLEKQILRTPRELPCLVILKKDAYEGNWKDKRQNATVEDMLADLVSFEWQDISIVGYTPHGKLNMNMAV